MSWKNGWVIPKGVFDHMYGLDVEQCVKKLPRKQVGLLAANICLRSYNWLSNIFIKANASKT